LREASSGGVVVTDSRVQTSRAVVVSTWIPGRAVRADVPRLACACILRRPADRRVVRARTIVLARLV
jgi:hypothetical protein